MTVLSSTVFHMCKEVCSVEQAHYFFLKMTFQKCYIIIELNQMNDEYLDVVAQFVAQISFFFFFCKLFN